MAIYSWFTHEKWWFSIVMLVYQRVTMKQRINFNVIHRRVQKLDQTRKSIQKSVLDGKL